MSTDRIEKRVTLRAPRERVWHALADSKQFGAWFGVEFQGPFVAGQRIVGHMAPTQVDPEVAKLQEPYRGAKFECWIETIEPMTRFSFRWHPYAIDPDVDYSAEPTTLVAFELGDAADGRTSLTITESGFDQIPLARRAKAFAANEGGWAHQSELLAKYVTRAS